MLEIDIPGFGRMTLKHLVLDYNGTIALDGNLLDGVGESIVELSRQFDIHVLTADTHGHCRQRLAGLPLKISVLDPGPEDLAKLEYVKGLGAPFAVCIGNGANDHLMLKAAAVGIVVIGGEGAAARTVGAADLVATGIHQALDLLKYPKRLVAGLRT